jgi:hypothetical protein
MENQDKKTQEEDSLKIPYSIRTMDSDLKKEDLKTGSFDLRKKEQDNSKKDLPIQIEKREEKKENQTEKSPFLENLNSRPQNQPVKNGPEHLPEKNKEEIKIKEKAQKNKSLVPNNLNKIKLEKTTEKKVFSNNLILILLLVISLITISSGLYYFFYLNKQSPLPVPENINNTTVETENELTEEKNEENFNLINFSTLELKEDGDLINLLRNKKDQINTSLNFEIVENNQKINTESILNQLGFSLPQELLEQVNGTWLNLNKEDSALKLGLVFKINDAEKVASILLNNEPSLPEMLSPLFVDEVFILQDEEISFANSQELAGVRYYNLVKGFNNKAIDWKIQNNEHLLITTSQKTMEDLIYNLENNQIEIEEEKVNKVENQEIPVDEIEIETN